MTHTNEKGHGCDPVPSKNHTYNAYEFATAGNQGKALAIHPARLSLAGHVVHTGQYGGVIDRKYDLLKYFAEPQAFAVKLRFKHE